MCPANTLHVSLSATLSGIANEGFQGEKLILWLYTLIKLFPSPLYHLRRLPGVLWISQPEAE